MSYPPDPNNPYGQPQPGYGPPQGQPQQPPAYGYPQQPGYDPNAAYGYPQQAANPYGGAPYGAAPYGAAPYGGPQIASMGARFGARLIDSVIIGVVYWIVMFAGLAGAIGIGSSSEMKYNPTTGRYEMSDSASMGMLGIMLVTVLVFYAIQLCYEWLMIAYAGATLGKRAVGLRVVNETTGQNPGLGASFLRFLIPMVGWIMCYLPGLLVWLSPFFDSSGKRQGWHDKAAHTVVIKK